MYTKEKIFLRHPRPLDLHSLHIPIETLRKSRSLNMDVERVKKFALQIFDNSLRCRDGDSILPS